MILLSSALARIFDEFGKKIDFVEWSRINLDRNMINFSGVLATVAPLKKNGVNFKSWKRTVTQRLTNNLVIQYFTGEEEASAGQDGHLIEFLFSTVEPVVLDMIDFNESEDTSGDLWCEVIRFGSSKRESSLETIWNPSTFVIRAKQTKS